LSTDQPTLTARARARGGVRRLVVLATVFATVTLWLGCSVQKHYKLLSFFFDGVPDPNAPITLAGGGRIPGLVYYPHKPYEDNQCAECHSSPAEMVINRDDSSACLNCHAAVVNEYALMHGPVAAAACLWCHAPHESPLRPLLRARGPELCTQCHGLELMNSPQPPEHHDLKRDCLGCHFGHGGTDPFFLLPPEDMPKIVPPPAPPGADEAAS
jgi:predicted CXXCH cytochrome family protein